MRSSISKLLIIFAACAVVLVAVVPSEAQRRGRRARGPAYTRTSVDRIIRRVEERSDAFVRLFDRALDRSRLDNSRREDRLNERARELETELDQVRQEFDRSEGYLDVRGNVARAMNVSEGINNVVRNRRLTPQVERQWVLLRTELNQLARVYNLRLLR
jgi:hypothetical protein